MKVSNEELISKAKKHKIIIDDEGEHIVIPDNFEEAIKSYTWDEFDEIKFVLSKFMFRYWEKVNTIDIDSPQVTERDSRFYTGLILEIYKIEEAMQLVLNEFYNVFRPNQSKKL
jgi:hypothetical protein